MQSKEKEKIVPIEQLFFHNSDTLVKPIIGNQEIEKTPEISMHKEALPFIPYSPDDVANLMETQKIEKHFNDIHTFLSMINHFE